MLKNGENSRFTQEQEEQYLMKDPLYNISLDGEYYVCTTCLNQIKQGRKPKRNDRDLLHYYDFPKELFKEIERKSSNNQEFDIF